MSKVGRKHRPYRQGGKPDQDAAPEKLPEKAPNKSWQPGRPGQGGEGMSEVMADLVMTRQARQARKMAIVPPRSADPPRDR